MSRGIAVHVVAGILFVGLGTSDAQESVPRPAVVEARDTSSPKSDMPEPAALFRLGFVSGIEGDVGVTVAIAPPDASDSPQVKAGPTRRWFTGAMRRMLEFAVAVCLSVRAGDEAPRPIVTSGIASKQP